MSGHSPITPEQFRALRSRVAIVENGDPLVELPPGILRAEPHSYKSLGAPYGALSPFLLRSEVAQRLIRSQRKLEELREGCRLMVWDAYRPIAVQQFMLEYTIAKLAEERGATDMEALRSEAFTIWAPPSRDPNAPSPHSTGGAIDITVCDKNGRTIDMGSEIDALPPQCLPDYYKNKTDTVSRMRDENRTLLLDVMLSSGFHRLPYEWWHFSYGDQSWAYIEQQRTGAPQNAKYGALNSE